MILSIKNKKIYFDDCIKKWFIYKKYSIKESSYLKYCYTYDKYIAKYFDHVSIKKLDNKFIDNYLDSDEISSLSTSTKKTIIYIINSTITYCKNKNIKINIDKIDIQLKTNYNKNDIEYLTKKEQHKLERYLLKHLSLNNTSILLCLYTGIRLGELCGLKWDDIDFTNCSLTIDRTIQRITNLDLDDENNSKTKLITNSPKSTRSKRVIPIPKFIIDELKKYYHGKNEYVLSNKSVPIDPRTMELHLKKLLKTNKIKDMKFHGLRHTFATRCIESNIDIKTLSELLGHSSYRITLDIYVHSSFDLKKKSINSLAKNITKKNS
jgi:integrase